MTVIGIDLGTSYSCVGVFRHNRVDIIPNDMGNLKTPSYVAFTDEELLVGDSAKNQVAMNPTNTVFDVLRLIGRNFSDPAVQRDMLQWPFKILRGDSDKPQIEVQWRGEMKQFYPEEILSMILRKMKEMAEIHISEKVTEAVISIPAYFNDKKRRIIKDAATIAGLEVPYLICSSTAAAIAYGLNVKSDEERHVLVFDLGGGTFDCSLLDIDGGMFEVRAIAGDTHLGGEDFDSRMVNYFADCFKRKFKCDLRQSPRALRTLRTACERAKRTLSTATTASIICDSLYEGHDFMDNISRAMFENLNDELFRSTMNPVAQVLKDANMSKSDVTDIVLVGGSSRIPRVQQLLQDFFNGKQPCRGVDPDEAVAYGAAVQAACYKGSTSSLIKDLLFLDVTPLSLGIETDDQKMTVIIPRNSTIPFKKSIIISTTRDNQTSYTIKVYEGERSRTRDNNLLGSFDLTGIPPNKKGVPQIEVTFDINARGDINVSAQDKSTGNIEKITIENKTGSLSAFDIKNFAEKLEIFIKQDEEVRKKVEAKNALEGYCFGVRNSLSNEQFANAIPQSDKDTINKEINDTLAWIDAHQDAEVSEFESKQKELESKLMPIMQRAYQGAVPGGSAGGPGGMPGGIDPNMFNHAFNSNESKENLLIEIQNLKDENSQIKKEVEQLKSYISALAEKSRIIEFVDLTDYDEVSIIGEGVSSNVKLVTRKEKYAKKELKELTQEAFQRLLFEGEILFKLHHPCIVRIIGINNGDETHPPSIFLSFEPRSLEKSIHDKELDNHQKNRITIEIVLGMRYIHKHNLMHRDLKPSNILLSKNMHVRISDFGLAKEENLETSQSKGVGTMRFMAPELFEENDGALRYDNKVDVYSFGITLIYIITEQYPDFSLKNAVTGVAPKIKGSIVNWVREVISRCLSVSPENRPSFNEIFEIMKSHNYNLFSEREEKVNKDIESRICKIEAFEYQHKNE
ncbi:hypothetical protein M9Y10_011101 [Tritrichomonas musculus]|uniref:Protein kinase domain-containing protein n=1 Tax=Tritrichomonas musculus TaxID=1915356 RepID=A0ABR2IMQ4_9EUKA